MIYRWQVDWFGPDGTQLRWQLQPEFIAVHPQRVDGARFLPSLHAGRTHLPQILTRSLPLLHHVTWQVSPPDIKNKKKQMKSCSFFVSTWADLPVLVLFLHIITNVAPGPVMHRCDVIDLLLQGKKKTKILNTTLPRLKNWCQLEYLIWSLSKTIWSEIWNKMFSSSLIQLTSAVHQSVRTSLHNRARSRWFKREETYYCTLLYCIILTTHTYSALLK